jgi:two-component system NtrC family sensor kinase
MPVMNGVEFLKAVYERWPDTVRIVLSGYADAGAIVAAINEGHIYKFIQLLPVRFLHDVSFALTA